MAVHHIRNDIECRTLNIIGGSREFFFFSLFAVNIDGLPQGPLDLSNASEIEWLFAPFSVIKEKSHAIFHKLLTTDEIRILRDGSDGEPNLIQVIVEPLNTRHLSGAFLHQVSITDGQGYTFIPFEGLININRRIQTR